MERLKKMQTDLATVIEIKSRVDVLEERFERHLTKIETDVTKLSDKIDLLASLISQNRIEQVKDDRDTRMKIYTMAGVISFIISAIAAMLNFLKQNNQ